MISIIVCLIFCKKRVQYEATKMVIIVSIKIKSNHAKGNIYGLLNVGSLRM